MPIKIIATSLAFLALISFNIQGPIDASSESSFVRAITTGADFGLRGGNFKVTTTALTSNGAGSLKPGDFFRAIIDGIQVQDGDAISFTFEGPDGRVDLGSPVFTGANASLSLAHRKAKGTLGASPYRFESVRYRFNPRRNRLLLLARRGAAQATPVITTLTGGKPLVTENVAIDVTVHVRRAGEADSSLTVNGQFRVRHSTNRRQELEIYMGVAR